MLELTTNEILEMMDKLSYCPFCGSKAVFDCYGFRQEHKVVKCVSCNARIEYDDETNHGYLVLFDKWNQRAKND